MYAVKQRSSWNFPIPEDTVMSYLSRKRLTFFFPGLPDSLLQKQFLLLCDLTSGLFHSEGSILRDKDNVYFNIIRETASSEKQINWNCLTNKEVYFNNEICRYANAYLKKSDKIQLYLRVY